MFSSFSEHEFARKVQGTKKNLLKHVLSKINHAWIIVFRILKGKSREFMIRESANRCMLSVL